MTGVNVEDSIEKPASTSQIPSAKPTMYDYFLDVEKKSWIAWDWVVPEYVHDSNMNFSEILVPTIDTLKIDKILTLMNQVIRNIHFHESF